MRSDDPEAVGRRLVEAMSRKRTKNPAVAKELGVHPTTVSKWRQGVQPIEQHRRATLAAFLGVTEPWLFRGEGGDYPTANTRQMRASEALTVTAVPGLPRALEIQAAEYELEAMKGGATNDDMDYIRTALRSPEAVQLYRGGYAEPLTIAEQQVEMDSLIEMLRLWLKERIRRRRDAER